MHQETECTIHPRGNPMRSVALRLTFSAGFCVAMMACGGGSSQTRASRPQPVTDSLRTSNGVTAADIQDQPGQPLEKILAGKVSGVDVTRGADGNLSVRIRGASS